MKKRNNDENLSYDEQAIEETTNQIMDAYASGVVDQTDGQFYFYDRNED
ncbi:hypothetical protein [Bacillus sp. FJAT-49736]|nr:hypothetical protein [Bacillus sp. FJAT-49736]MBS4173809.1 hypothetical protein [Bacillus sp. FJAT-49736]